MHGKSLKSLMVFCRVVYAYIDGCRSFCEWSLILFGVIAVTRHVVWHVTQCRMCFYWRRSYSLCCTWLAVWRASVSVPSRAHRATCCALTMSRPSGAESASVPTSLLCIQCIACCSVLDVQVLEAFVPVSRPALVTNSCYNFRLFCRPNFRPSFNSVTLRLYVEPGYYWDGSLFADIPFRYVTT